MPNPVPLPFDPSKIGEYARWSQAATANLEAGKPGDDPRDPSAFVRYLKAVGKDYLHPMDYGLPYVVVSPKA